MAKLLALLVPIFLFSASCDHTNLTCEIVIKSSELKIGNEYNLHLEIPSELDEIYWITWQVEPTGTANIDFEYCNGDDCGKGSGYKGDRTAVLTPIKSGEIEVVVSGFYKQTNPQPITRKKLILISEKP